MVAVSTAAAVATMGGPASVDVDRVSRAAAALVMAADSLEAGSTVALEVDSTAAVVAGASMEGVAATAVDTANRFEFCS
jgi:lipid-binding SYLF domain-containing protein